MAEHTPGPWHVVKNPMRDDGWFVVRDWRADEIKREGGGTRMTSDRLAHLRRLGRARIDAGDPAGLDVVELCDAVREQWQILQAALDDALSSPRDIDSVVAILEDALAKAEGR